MSKIGKRIINIPSNVFVNFTGNTFIITGVLGSFTFTIQSSLSVLIFCNFLSIFFKEKTKLNYRERAYFGTVQSILLSAIIGVCIGFKKRLLLNGIGYKASLIDTILVLRVGHSHKIECLIPVNLKVTIENFTIINVFGIDKQAVGQFVSSIVKFRPIDSYKGKGISYDGISVKLKEVKKK